jgi:hypothetical protein
MADLVVEAIVVGLVVLLMGNLVGWSLNTLNIAKVPLPPVCDSWNDLYVKELMLFLTGFLSHLVFEAMGANKWYCTHGYACQ